MKYKFIRTGHRPVDEVDHDDVIRECFTFCTNEVKSKLDAFFKDVRQPSVTFEFDRQQVRVERITK